MEIQINKAHVMATPLFADDAVGLVQEGCIYGARMCVFLCVSCVRKLLDQRNLARQRPMISFWQTSSALNSLPSSVR